jgi:hypothetical protein
MKDYNDWTNKQTWNINMSYEAIFTDMAEEQEWDDVHQLADAFEALVNDREYDSLTVSSLAKDAVGEYLELVNWEEIAEHYFEGHISEQDREKIIKIVDSLSL